MQPFVAVVGNVTKRDQIAKPAEATGSIYNRTHYYLLAQRQAVYIPQLQ